MRDPDQFDTFYKDARDRLLVQTFCFTGDLPAARHAVRDAFVVAWHRWRKVSRVSDPESVVRPDAWRIAQRRHTTRVWHREKDLDDEVRATLDALGKLTVNQRKALLLTQLASVSMPQMAREIGLPLERAEQELQAGVAQLSLQRDVPSYAVPALLEPVAAAALADTHWPRATIVRRAGATRRRTHTLVGVAGAVAAVLVSGTLVTDAAGVRASLDRADDPRPAAPAGRGERAMTGAPPMRLPETSLLDTAALGERFAGRAWEVQNTGDNGSGSGRAMPCQGDRYADPRGEAALVRTSLAPGVKKRPMLRAVQLTEASPREAAAERAFDTAVSWFSACTTPSVQLLDTVTPVGVGDEAVHLVLRSTAAKVPETWLVGVARTGLFTTTTFVRATGDPGPEPQRSAELLADAVGRLCGLEGAGTSCRAPGAKPLKLAPRDPLPAGEVPALLSELDLSPVPKVRRPWVGTVPRRPQAAAMTTPCGPPGFLEKFRGTAFDTAATRSFVVPEARLPEEFGLTQTVAALPPRVAKRFVQKVRDRFASCPDRELGTEVDQVATADRRGRAYTVWRLDVRVTEQRSIPYWVAILRNGTAVGQLDLVPADVRIGEPEVEALAERAVARLGELPAPGS